MVPLTYFCFCCLCFWCQIQKKIIAKTKIRKLPCMFSSRFYSFRSYIQVLNPFWVDFCISHFWDSDLVSFFCMWLSSFPNAIYWRDYSFSAVYSWLLCWKLIDYICMSWFLGSLFFSGLPWWLSGKESSWKYSRCGKISWRRKRQPPPVFLPGKSLGQRNLEGTVHGVARESSTT